MFLILHIYINTVGFWKGGGGGVEAEAAAAAATAAAAASSFAWEINS